MIEVKLLD